MAETVGMGGVAKLYFYKMMPDSSPRKTDELLQEGIGKTKPFLKVMACPLIVSFQKSGEYMNICGWVKSKSWVVLYIVCDCQPCPVLCC